MKYRHWFPFRIGATVGTRVARHADDPKSGRYKREALRLILDGLPGSPIQGESQPDRSQERCEDTASPNIREEYAFTVFERLFQERGLPANIRSDNGVPFASAHALFNLSKLAVWWLRLGIGIERIQPGHPQQNGRHEPMHLTLKKETTKPAAANFLQQQARFDDFIEVFNQERPHQALDMKCPAEVYRPSTRVYQGLPDIDYPFHDKVIVVTNCGRICLGRKKINFSTVFAGQAVGIKEVHDDIWLVSFMDYDLGYFDLDTRVMEPLDNPFGPRLLPM